MIYQIFKILAVALCLVACKPKDEVPVAKLNFPAGFVVNGGDNSISVLDLNKLEIQTTWNFAQTGDFRTWGHHIYISPDNKKLAIATPEYDFTLGHDASHTATDKKGGVIILDAQNGKILQKFDVPGINHNAIFTNDGKEIWTTLVSHSGRILVYDTEKGTLLKSISIEADPSEIIISKNGKYAFVACQESSFLTVVDVQSKTVIKNIKVDKAPTNVWASADGNIYVENKNQKSITIINTETLTSTEIIDVDFAPSMVSYSVQNNELWVCGAKTDAVYIFERQENKWKMKTKIATGNDAHAIIFLDNQAFIINQGGNSVSVIDTKTKQIIKTISVGNKPNGMVLVR